MSDDDSSWGGIADEFEDLEASETSDSSETREPSDLSDPSDLSEASGPSEPSEPSPPSETDVRLATPIKSEWEEYPTYLYPELYERVEDAWMDIEYQCRREADWSPEKYRHFQAVAWHVALEQLEEMDAEEFVDVVDDLGLR